MSRGIVVCGLAKRLGAVRAVADVSFAVAPGEVLGLLGPNGAGKTTTIEAITGLIAPDAGTIEIGGIDARARPGAARRKIGVVLQSTGLQDRITPREAIGLFAALHGIAADAPALLARFGLADKADAAFATLSGGQQQRLALALAFVGDPEAVFLDEPTAGLDPAMRRALHAMIRAMRDEGRAVLLATHDMDEAERLCDRVAVLDRGRIVAEGAPAALVARARAAAPVVLRTDGAPAAGWPATLPGVGAVTPRPDGIGFATDDLAATLPAALAWLAAAGVRVTGVSAEGATLEDVIVRLAAAWGTGG